MNLDHLRKHFKLLPAEASLEAPATFFLKVRSALFVCLSILFQKLGIVGQQTEPWNFLLVAFSILLTPLS